MHNPLLKNNKTKVFDDLQHRTSHYNKILGAKSTYTTNKICPSIVDRMHTKYYTSSEQNRKQGNKKLIKSLISIQKQNSRYAYRDSKQKSPKSLKNQYAQKQHTNRIIGQNLQLYRKISEAMPSIGSKKQWKNRTKRLLKYSKLKSSNRSVYLQLDQQLYNTYNRIKTNQAINQTSLMKFQFSRRTNLYKRMSNRCVTQGHNL